MAPRVPERAKADPMDPAHMMDWAPLNLGHPHVSKQTVHLVDLDVHVYGLDEIANSTLPVAIIIVAHGWANKARDMEPMASGLIGEARRLDSLGGRKRTRDVLVATLDQRNHGERRRIRTKLTFESNPRRLIDSSMAMTGGKQDHQFILEFLAAALFPNEERIVEEYMATGFSMGGHVVWRLLREEPRIRIAVPICSVPSEALGPLLLSRRLPEGSPASFVPSTTHTFFAGRPPKGTYAGKCILAIHGDLDALLPWEYGDERWHEIAAEVEGGPAPGAAERWVQPGVGHIVSTEMVRRTAAWCWHHGLTQPLPA